jgi:hypothetical protein
VTTDRAGVVRLPAGLTASPQAAGSSASAPAAGPSVAIPASQAPEPIDRVSALRLVRESDHESFVVGVDGRSPRLLSRAEALRAIEGSGEARIVAMPLSDAEAEALDRWIAEGRPVGAAPWLADLEQSAAARAERDRRREAELEHIRAQRQKLRDALYRRLAGEDAGAAE